MIVLILLSCTSCGVKQNTDKQEVKKKREKINMVLKKENNKFVVDTQLSDILQTEKNIELVDCFQSKWYFEGEQIYCYDSKNNEYKEISANSKELNIYRVLKEGSW